MHLEKIGCEGVDWIHLAQYMFHWRDGKDPQAP
jgi:hypothetical protein